MQRAERDLARGRVTGRGRLGRRRPALVTAVAGLRQHSIPYHLAHGLLDYAVHLAARGEAEPAKPSTSLSGWAANRC